MAREEIKLVGSFKDDITPQLKKLNKEIASIGRSFERFNKKIAPVTKSFAKMAMSARTFSEAMTSQRRSIEGSARSMREYSRQAGKMTSAMRKVQAIREKTMRQQGVSRAQMRKGGGATTAAMAGPAPSSTRQAKTGGAAIGASAGQSFMKNVASTAIGMGIANAFMGGIGKLKNLAMTPFNKFRSAFVERMNDEMDDIKSAGGMYALDMDLTGESGNKRLFNNFNEALRFQEEINTRMAASASNLPGTTSDFVNMNRRMTDTIQMVMEKNRETFVKFGEEQGADISMGGTGAAKEAMAQVGQNLTESLMLASAGQQGGLPMDIAIQQLMNKEQGKIKMQAFTNKFRAAFQKNPLLKNFLMRGEEELNKTAAGSTERLKIIADIFDRAIPEDQINKMRGSLNGLVESVRSGLLDPQGGLFGMSRAVQQFDKEGNVIGPLMKKNVDDMGEILYRITDPKNLKGLDGKEMVAGAEYTAAELDKLGLTLSETGDVLNAAGNAVGETSMSTTYLFEQLREIGANYGAVLTQFVGLLPTIFDPFAKMTEALIPMREESIAFFNVFRKFNKNLQGHSDYLRSQADSAKKGLGVKLGKQVMGRSALATLADFLAGTGAMEADAAAKIVDQMMGKNSMTADAIKNFDKTAANAFKTMFDSLLNSDLISRVGKVLGTVIGGIIRTTFDVINGLMGNFVKGGPMNKLMEGFMEGFGSQFADMGGISGFMQKANDLLAQVITVAAEFVITNVIPVVMKSLIQLILGGFKAGPIGALMSGAALVGIVKILVKVNTGLVAMAASLQMATKAANQFAIGAGFKKGMFNSKQAGALQGNQFKQFLKGKGGFGGIGKTLLKGAKSSAGLSAIFGVLDAGSRIAAGEDVGRAVGGAASTVIGSVLGGAVGSIFGPAGTVIGSMAGGMLADTIYDSFKSPADKQAEAVAQFQEAVNTHAETLAQTGAEVTGEVATASVNPLKTLEALKASGLLGTEAGTEIARSSNVVKEKTELAAMAGSGVNEIITKLKNLGMSSDKIAENPEYRAAQDRLTRLNNEAAEATAKLSDAMNQLNPVQLQSFLEALQMDPSKLAGMQEFATSTAAANEPLGAFKDSLIPVPQELSAFSSSMNELPGKVEAPLIGAATTTGSAITLAGGNLATALNGATAKINSVSTSVPSGPKAESKFDGKGGKMMPLGRAIETERKNMPAGSNLVIANSSETVIPAYKGHKGEGFKGLSFAELESAAGFDRMASYTDQIAELADKTAASFSGGFGGALGGGSATLNAMEALGHSFGLVTTSGFRPGDPGFHGVNRARDLSNGGGETPEMNAAAAKMASEFGSSLTELIYTPMGFSIKNGQKTGLISPANHYHHIHVAVAEGLAKAAVFNSQKAAEQYERRNMPAGATPMKVDLSSMTANSSEFGGGGLTIGDINVSVSGNDPKQIANEVAEEILFAIKKTTYGELYTN